MEKGIKKILKKHSMFQDQDNGFRVWRLYKDKWTDVAKDIESLVKKSNDIQPIIISANDFICKDVMSPKPCDKHCGDDGCTKYPN